MIWPMPPKRPLKRQQEKNESEEDCIYRSPGNGHKTCTRFYEGVLGLKVSGEFGEGVWIEYEIGPDTLAIGSVGDQWKPSEDGTSVAIEVEDFDAAMKRLKQANARIAAEGIESPVCWMAVVQDPDGNKIIIHKLKKE